MSDASTSLDEDMDNNIDEEEDSMNTSSDEIGSSRLNRLEDDGSDIASTSTNDHHGSDKDIDDANGDETSTNSGVSDTDMADANGEEVENDNDSTNKSLLSGESSSSQDDYSSDDEEGREEMLEMFIVETCKFEEMSNLLEGLISRELIKSNQYDSFATAFEALGFARSKRLVLRHTMFYHIDEEKFEELERLGKEKGMESFINVTIKLGYADQLKTWPKISGYMGTSDKPAAGNNNNIGDGSSSGNSGGGDNGGSSIHQQHNMRRTSLEQEQDDGDDAAPLIRKRGRSSSSSSSSSDIDRLTKHCNSSSSSDGESDQGRRRRRRRLDNGTESPRQESERERALALENARLRKKVETLEKKKDSVATKAKEAKLKKQQQAITKERNQLTKTIAKEEARILQAKEDAKAESDRLARLARDRDAIVEQELEKRAKEEKDRLTAERLSIEYDKIRSLFDSLNTHAIAVGSLREVEAVASRLEAAFNPQAPNLSLIPEITRDLLAIHQNISKYKKLITNHVTVQQTKDNDPLIDISLNDGIGTILSNIAKNVAAKDRALNHVVSPELLELMAAAQRFQTGKECDIPSELSSADSNDLLDLLKSDQGVANLVLHCVHLTLMVWVESELSVEQLYLHLDEDGLLLATELSNQVRQGEPLDLAKTSSLEYREKIIIPALNGNDERLQQLATQVAMAFANNLTLSGSDERVAIIQPVLQFVEKKRFDGSRCDDLQCSSSYFSEPGDQHKARRKSCTCIFFNASASELIESRLQVPDGDSMVDLFPDGYLRALLINSSTFLKKNCNFISPNRGLFKEGHDLVQTAKLIHKNMKSRDVTEEKKVIIGRNEKDSLKRLFGI